jgi:hypothetical protein
MVGDVVNLSERLEFSGLCLVERLDKLKRQRFFLAANSKFSL